MGKRYCTHCGVELPAEARFCGNCGNSVNDDFSSELEQTSIYSPDCPKDEVTRLVIEEMGTDGISGLDKSLLTEKLLYFYDNNISRPERIDTIMNTFDIDYETADKIDWLSSTKISLFTDYFNNKTDGATNFDIKGKNGVLKTDVPVSEFMANVGFIIENDAVPIFKTSNDVNLVTEDNQLTTYSTVNYVDLYETRAVRHSRGSSYGRKGYRAHSSTSTSKQEWQKLGRGKMTLQGDNCIFIGGGERRIIDRKKILDIIYYSNSAGFEVTVSNRQKTMRFMLPGRDIEDGQRLANAIKNGKSSVALKELTKDPGNCYIATYVYGDYDASEVLTLRKFRDEKLLNNFIGKGFVKFYYSTSPFLIEHFGGKLFRKTSKKFLDYIVNILN